MGTVGQRLKAALAAKGMSKAELARRCGVTRSAVTFWTKADNQTLRGDNLIAVASVLDVSPAWLEGGAGEMGADLTLSMEEKELFHLWRELEPAHQVALLGVARTLRQSQPDTPPSKTSPFKQKIHR